MNFWMFMKRQEAEMNPFKQKRKILTALRSIKEEAVECPSCSQSSSKEALAERHYVCPFCGYHYRISARYRLKMVADPGSLREICGSVKSENPLNFPGYDEKLAQQREQTGLKEAVIAATGKIGGRKAVLCAMDSRFMMGSMGTAVGEKITRACEYALKKKLPLIIFCTSGGARMQEGILSLFQMAKTSAAVTRHSEAGLLYISVLTNPTTGGVTASFASLGDIILAEPDALIGFAGPRVIEQTIGQKLPEGFQRAEFMRAQGFVDCIVERGRMRVTLEQLLRMHDRRGKFEQE